MVRGISLLCLMVLGFTAFLALAAGANAAQVPQSDGLYLRPMGQEVEAPYSAAPRLAQTMQLDIAGIIVRGKVTQLFKNDGETWVEGSYRFPLPDGAAVDTLRIRVDDRLIEGEIREREEARAAYEEAREAGQTAALLDEDSPNRFMISLANIGPGETISVALEFQSTVARQGDAFEFRMPLVVAPRYLPDIALSAQDHPAIQSEIRRHIENAARLGFPVDLSRGSNQTALGVTLDAGMELAMLESPSHDLVVSREGNQYRIGLRLESEPADRDIILRWQGVRKEVPGAMLFHERIGDVDYLLAMIQPPDTATARTLDRPRDVTFIVDTSGSMEGESIQAARVALIEALAGLTSDDRFEVIEFNQDYRRLFGSSQPATATRVETAVRFVAGLRADGGTEMAAPLRAALSNPGVESGAEEGAVRQIVFLTDGHIGNEDELFRMIEANLGNARLFTVSLGSAPNGWFMRKSAELGAGETLSIADVSEAGLRMAEFYVRIENPVVVDLALSADPGSRMDVQPSRLPDLYGARALIVPLAIENWGGSLTLTGEMSGDPLSITLTRDDLHPASGVAKLWAEGKVEAIQDDIRRGVIDPDAGRLAVLDVAIPHRLATAYTSFVAVDRPIRRPDGSVLDHHDMPNNMPAGMVMASLAGPAGSLGWQGMILTGLAFITGSLGLLLVGRRLGGGPV